MYVDTLKVIPFVWVCVIILVPFVVNPLVTKLVQKFAGPTDGFNARVLFTILFSVSILSVLLTVIGSWIGMGKISWKPIHTFFYDWPRNFFITFWVETLIAQPVARFAMKKLHESLARKAVNA